MYLTLPCDAQSTEPLWLFNELLDGAALFVT